MKKIIINFYFIFILLFLSINAQIVWDFHVNDKKDKKVKTNNNNLRSTFEVPTESEMGFKTVINACLGTKPQCFELGVQTNTFYIWVRSAGSKEKDSETNSYRQMFMEE